MAQGAVCHGFASTLSSPDAYTPYRGLLLYTLADPEASQERFSPTLVLWLTLVLMSVAHFTVGVVSAATVEDVQSPLAFEMSARIGPHKRCVLEQGDRSKPHLGPIVSSVVAVRLSPHTGVGRSTRPRHTRK